MSTSRWKQDGGCGTRLIMGYFYLVHWFVDPFYDSSADYSGLLRYRGRVAPSEYVSSPNSHLHFKGVTIVSCLLLFSRPRGTAIAWKWNLYFFWGYLFSKSCSKIWSCFSLYPSLMSVQFWDTGSTQKSNLCTQTDNIRPTTTVPRGARFYAKYISSMDRHLRLVVLPLLSSLAATVLGIHFVLFGIWTVVRFKRRGMAIA